MDNEFLKWSIGVLASSGIIGGAGILFRDALGRFMGRAIEHKFERKIEEFKSEVREGEKELEQIRSYISFARTGRDSILQVKKVEAAEKIINARQFLFRYMIVAKYMQALKVDALIKNKNEDNVRQFIKDIIQPLKLDDMFDEYQNFDVNTPRLYLGEKSIKVFDIYSGIIMCGAGTLRSLEFTVGEESRIMDFELLIDKIVDLMPWSKKGFERYGDNYVFHLHDHFYDEVLNELRNELIGDENIKKDAEVATQLALSFRDSQKKVKESLGKYGISDELVYSSNK
ncbi:TPA: hypothetical protein ACU92A_003322 [Citrobacter braakii]